MLTCIAYAIKKVSTSTLPVVNSSALVLWTFSGWLELNKTRDFLTFWQGKLALAMPKKKTCRWGRRAKLQFVRKPRDFEFAVN